MRLGLALLAFAGLNGSADAGTLRKIWDSVIPGAESRAVPLGIFALGFSRDGQQIALVVGKSDREESVLILNARDASYVKLDLNPQISEHEPGGSRRIEWSLSGQQVILANKVVRVSDGAACTLPGIAPVPGYRFIGATQVVGFQFKPSRVAFFDLDCQVTSTWELPEGERLDKYDASAERSLLFATQSRVSGVTLTEVSRIAIDVNSKKIVKTLPKWTSATALTLSAAISFDPQFADSGKAFCWIRGETWHRIVGCSAVDTDQVYSVTKEWNDPDVRTALGAPRIIISDYSKKLDWIDFFWYSGAPRMRMVWDFQASKELVRWRPKEQKVFTGSASHTTSTRQPYRFDISPDGSYIVEGGAGVVSLYKIEP